MSVCVSVHVCAVYTITQNIMGHLKLEHIVIYENSSDEFDIRHCLIKVKLVNFSPFTTIQKLSSPISQLWQMLGSCD